MFQRISKTFIVSIMLIALVSVFQSAADIAANKAVVLRAVECWNTGNLAIADEILSTDFVNHDPGHPDVTNLETYKGLVIAVRTIFPDFHLEVHDMVAEGDKLVTR